MCTATWLLDGDGGFLLFTRDERHSRAPAEPPGIRLSGGIRYIAPRDPEGGGTWIAATEHGIVLGLLNDYPAGFALLPRGGSRGELIPDLIARSAAWWSAGAGLDSREAERQVRELATERTLQAFQLVILPPGSSQAWYCGWDGQRSHWRPGSPPETISSLHPELLGRRRREIYDRIVGPRPTRQTLWRYHSFRGADPALGPWMWRPEAGSQSITEVRVDGSAVTMAYYREPGSDPTEVKLPRS